MENIEINFKNQKYFLERSKLIYVLSKLENRNLDKIADDEILVLFKKYDLYDEIFLTNVNKI